MKPTDLPASCPKCLRGCVSVHYIRKDDFWVPGWVRCSRLGHCGWWVPIELGERGVQEVYDRVGRV
jgi:hypothetical protein